MHPTMANSVQPTPINPATVTIDQTCAQASATSATTTTTAFTETRLRGTDQGRDSGGPCAGGP